MSSLWQRKPNPGKSKMHVDSRQHFGVGRSRAAAVLRLETFSGLWRLCLKTVVVKEEAQTELCDGHSCHVSCTFPPLFFFVVVAGFIKEGVKCTERRRRQSRKERKRQAGSGFISEC